MSPRLRSSLILTVAGVVACGCSVPPTVAETEARLRQATASAISGVGDAKDIVISDAQAFPTRRQWRALAGGKLYACDADEQFNLPQCQAAEPTTARP
jgi:hypothetical protein